MNDVNMTKKDGSFRIIVHNVNNVPSLERFRGLPDPYVNVFYNGSFIFDRKFLLNFIFYLLGIKKQTNWQRSTCDPKWDEVKKIVLILLNSIIMFYLDA